MKLSVLIPIRRKRKKNPLAALSGVYSEPYLNCWRNEMVLQLREEKYICL